MNSSTCFSIRPQEPWTPWSPNGFSFITSASWGPNGPMESQCEPKRPMRGKRRSGRTGGGGRMAGGGQKHMNNIGTTKWAQTISASWYVWIRHVCILYIYIYNFDTYVLSITHIVCVYTEPPNLLGCGGTSIASTFRPHKSFWLVLTFYSWYARWVGSVDWPLDWQSPKQSMFPYKLKTLGVSEHGPILKKTFCSNILGSEHGSTMPHVPNLFWE